MFESIYNPFELVSKASIEIERRLTGTFEAQGKGLVDKFNSVKNKFPPNISEDIRYIGHVRNSVLHDGKIEILKPSEFIRRVNRVINTFDNISRKSERHQLKVRAKFARKNAVNKNDFLYRLWCTFLILTVVFVALYPLSIEMIESMISIFLSK